MDEREKIAAGVFAGIVGFYLIFLRRYKNYKRQPSICDPNEYNFEYVSKPVQMPATRGIFMRLLSRLVNSFFGHMVLADVVITQGGFDRFRGIKMTECPTFFPNVPFEGESASVDKRHESCSDGALEKVIQLDKDPGKGFMFNSIASFVSRYKNGNLTPTEVAERVLIGIKSTSELRSVIKYDAVYIREAAAASTERYKTHTTLSPVDGIFVIIKDEYSVKGFQHSKGTSFLGHGRVALNDSGLVAKLKDLGAIVVGVANMHELGLGTTGNNSNKDFGTCRNPYDVNHYTGGSSSGSAATVASGVCCMGLGSDGGGSIRIPSSYCGVVGLKPTFTRLAMTDPGGVAFSVNHAGPICGNVKDAAIFYALLAGPHPDYPLGMNQPVVTLPEFGGSLDGMRIAMDRMFFRTPPTRVFFKCGSALTAVDYIQACKQRTRAIRCLEEFFENYDAFVTPTAAHCAPKIVSSELSAGMLNGQQDTMNMRYAVLANLSGCPAITLPVGYNDAGLPIGLQFMSAWWREDIILKIAEGVERHVDLRKPKVFADLLED